MIRERPLLCRIIKVPLVEIDVGHAQPDRLAQPQAVQYSTRIRARSIEAPMKRPWWDAASAKDPAHLVVAEDVGQEDRFLDRRQGVLRHMAQRIAAAAVQAQLPDDAELVGQRHRLAAGDARAPPGYRLVKRHLAPLAPMPCDKAHEAVEHELGTLVGNAHRALEAQELFGIAGQFGGGDDHVIVGTGSETSRSDSVAILT